MKLYKKRWLSLSLAFLLAASMILPAPAATVHAETISGTKVPADETVKNQPELLPAKTDAKEPVAASSGVLHPVQTLPPVVTCVPSTQQPGPSAPEPSGDSSLAEKAAADRAIAEQMERNLSNTYTDVNSHVPVSVSKYKGYYPPQNASLDDAYDPRTVSGLKDRMPAVRDQNPLGTCWAHSAMFMSEMYLAKNGKSMSGEDLSEFQLAYFGSHDWEDPLGNATGDNFYRTDSSPSNRSRDWYNSGNTAFTKYMMMDWLGAVSEKTYPDTAYSVLLSSVNQTSGSSSAYLTSDYAISKDSVHVQDVSVINMSDKDTVKNIIQEYGSVGISYYSATSYYKTVSRTNTSFYYPNEANTNHAVAVVGWDDNYSKTNFVNTPPGNGAWLVRNSWGASWGDGGYFWLSYYDKTLSSVGYFTKAYQRGDAANYYAHNYQYDGGIDPGSSLNLAGSITGANVFTASGKEVLKAVSFYTEENYDYTVEVYTGLTDRTNPESGTLCCTMTGTQLFEGYHTVSLNSNVSLPAGTLFSVIVTLRSKNYTSTSFYMDRTYNGGWIYSSAEATTGVSFLSSGSSWIDAAARYQGNLRIKAYTNDDVSRPITSIQARRDSGNCISLKKGSTYDLLGSTSERKNLTVSPSSHDDQLLYSSENDRVASIDSNGVITAHNPGETTITISARCGSGRDSLVIKVPLEKPAESILLDRSEASVQVQKTLTLHASITPSDSDDYDACWTSSAPSIARVDSSGTVTGVTEGTAVITAKTLSGKTASCTVTVVKHSSENLTFAFNKIARKLYKGGSYTITLSKAMTKLKPSSIAWSCTSPNVTLSPLGENGINGCILTVNQTDSSKKSGERFKVQAKLTYAKLSKKGVSIRTKTFKKATASYNRSFHLALDKSGIVSLKKESITLVAALNDGDVNDQPTNKKLKWMITDATGKPDKNGKKVISVNGKGIVKTKGPGSTYLTVCAADSYDKKTRTYAVTQTIPVSCPVVTSVRFQETSATLTANATLDLKSRLVFNNGQSEPFNKDGMKLTWSSSNRKCVSVNSKGFVKVSKKAAPGTYTITVKAVGGVTKGMTVPAGSFTIQIS